MANDNVAGFQAEITNGLRRLPKDPAMLVRKAAEPSERSRSPLMAPVDEALYFAPLPEPAIEQTQVDPVYEDSIPLLDMRDDRTSAVSPELNPQAAERVDPAAFLRHNRRSDKDQGQDVEESANALQQVPLNSRRSTGERMQAALHRAKQLSDRVEQPVDTGATTQNPKVSPDETSEYSDYPADPRPAMARVSRVSRSRPAKPSGTTRISDRSAEDSVPHAAFRAPSGSHTNTSANPATIPAPSQEPTSQPKDTIVPNASATHERSAPVRPQAEASLPRRNASAPAGKAASIAGMMIVSVLLVAYAFAVGPLETAVDATVGHLMTGGAGSSAAQAFAIVLPWLLVVPALALFCCVVWYLTAIIGVRRPKRRSEKRSRTKAVQLPLNRFKSEADKHGIESRTAYRTWRLLQAACREDREIHVQSSLTSDLLLSAKDLRTVHLKLLKELSRVHETTLRLPPTETVLDLMTAAEDAPLLRTEVRPENVIVPGDPGRRKR